MKKHLLIKLLTLSGVLSAVLSARAQNTSENSTQSKAQFKEAEILLFDMSGRQLQSLKTKNKVTKVNPQTLIQGAYLVTIKTDTNKNSQCKTY
ncbi:T9SS type A sorting domain-containing protein [Chryseobacterium sp.]|uniref:T9SS type A sorting domain-containing protein n=1 Tax=Chryseobacterium sp. TaxID=1871047 RepID=UPI0033412232